MLAFYLSSAALSLPQPAAHKTTFEAGPKGIAQVVMAAGSLVFFVSVLLISGK